ncbi:MAG TPA: 50S ribosomal protein L11 methyltransferase [Burkholderiales bacterium]
MPWLALMLEVDTAAADALSDALLVAGARSVWQESTEIQNCRLAMLLDIDAEPVSVLSAAAESAGLGKTPRFSAARLEDEDWVRRSQAEFAPIAIGERLWVGPSWSEQPSSVAAAIILDPGIAFGTGSHPSTKLILNFLEKNIRGGERVLDYGCGSGILAIAAAKLGASHVDAVDIDPDAVRTAAANAAANGVLMRSAVPEELALIEYDLVVSNILAQPLILLAPLLAGRTRRGGWIALSGILETQAAEVADAYLPFFDAQIAQTEEGWALVAGLRR